MGQGIQGILPGWPFHEFLPGPSWDNPSWLVLLLVQGGGEVAGQVTYLVRGSFWGGTTGHPPDWGGGSSTTPHYLLRAMWSVKILKNTDTQFLDSW